MMNKMSFSQLTVKQTLSKLDTSQQGLSSQQAGQRLKKYGPNTLEAKNKTSIINKILAPFQSAFVIVLLIGALFSWLIGNVADTIIILIVVLINAFIEWGQQISADRVLASLKKYGASHVRVRRNNKVIKIQASQLVPGDIMLIDEGDKISADARLLQSYDLSIDESVLTGESQPVDKSAAALRKQHPIYERRNMLFRGTVAVAGRAVCVVTSTGSRTAFGQIAELSEGISEKPPIYNKIKKLTFYLVVATLGITAVVIGLGMARGFGLVEMLRFGIALIVSVIPEGLPVTLTIIFLIGVQRMAKQKAFVRNLPAVETLGMVTAVATDKTGTLTHSRLQIASIWDLDGSTSKDDYAQLWLSVSHRHPDLQHPVEKLVTEYTETKKTPVQWREVADMPFRTSQRYTLVLWKKGRRYRFYIKGAPEIIIDKCKLSRTDANKVKKRLDKMTNEGMRVVAIASKDLRAKPKKLSKVGLSNLKFVGLIGFREQIRKEAKVFIATTIKAGVRVYMLTGDHLKTARSIGKKLGIAKDASQIASGEEISKLSEADLLKIINKKRVFGRVLPKHKYKLMKAFKKNHITAMTGDGVNDVPALALADVGVAMGSGTDAAKEAADMVLLDDNYSTIVKAIRAGRAIYANVRKMIYYLLSTNMAEAMTIVVSLLVGLPLPVTAAQVLWLNLVTDTTMVIPIGLEPPEKDLMRQPPRRPNQPLLGLNYVSRLILMVLVMAAGSIFVFRNFLPEGITMARTMAFVTLSAVQWATAIAARSTYSYSWQNLKSFSPKLGLGIILSFALVLLVIYGPLSSYMGTQSLPATRWLWVIPPILLTIGASDLHKWISKKVGWS